MFPAILCLLAQTAVLARAAELSTVTLDYGTFTGLTNSSNGIIYFRGIRYAEPPLGALRWKAPAFPPSTHLGRVNATNYGSACIATTQKDAGPTTSEDCLFGNVFLPIATTARSALPVMVFFHGGGWEGGSARSAPPENIVLSSAKPLIFVTFGYRLGQFGFLGGTPVHDHGALNAGLLDQKAGLQWIQRYISKFGGDPRRVTLWGQSAGAGSTMFQMIAEGGKNTDLFHQVMGDSPPLIYLPHYTDAFVENLFTQFASLAGCDGSTSASTMACLRAAPTSTLALAGSNLLTNRTSTLYPLGPIFDGSFLRERPLEAFRNGHFPRVPVFFGSNSDEGSRWSSRLPNPDANTSSPDATQTTVYNFLAGQFATFTKASFQNAITRYYPLQDYNGSFSLQGQQMYGEMRFICTAGLITGTLQKSGIRAYQYHWDNPILGSNHADELAAFFDGEEIFDDADQELVVAMRRYWTSFVTDGKPVAKGSIRWPTSADINGGPRMLLHPGKVGVEDVTDALSARCAFWHNLASELKN